MPVDLDHADPGFRLCRVGADFHAVEHGAPDTGQLVDVQEITQRRHNLAVVPGHFVGCRFLDKLDTTGYVKTTELAAGQLSPMSIP